MVRDLLEKYPTLFFLRKPGAFQGSHLHEATLKLHTNTCTFYCLSIASVDDKQYLSEVVFSALVGFLLLEKYPLLFCPSWSCTIICIILHYNVLFSLCKKLVKLT